MVEFSCTFILIYFNFKCQLSKLLSFLWTIKSKFYLLLLSNGFIVDLTTSKVNFQAKFEFEIDLNKMKSIMLCKLLLLR